MTIGSVAYVRVSSRSQDDGLQRSAIERGALARGDTVVTWYAEKKSAKTTARPELLRLRADVRAGFVRKLYVFKLDRLVPQESLMPSPLPTRCAAQARPL